MTQRRLHLAAPQRILMMLLQPPLLVNLRELLTLSHSPRNPGEGGEGRTTTQPIKIRRTAHPPQ